MASPSTSVVHSEENPEVAAQKLISQATTDNVEGVVQALGLLQALEERGVLPVTRALVEQGDEVLKVILALVQREEYTGAIRNLISLLQIFTAIQPESMNSLLSGVTGGVKEAASTPPSEQFGVYDVLKSLKDPDVARALSFAISFLRGMGKGLANTSETQEEGDHA